jgi:hypothetical protein
VYVSSSTGGAALGSVLLNGTAITNGQNLNLSNLNGLVYVGGATQGTDAITLQALGAHFQVIGSTKVNVTDTANTAYVIGAGQTMELDGAYSGVITFAGATGTLKLDTSATNSVTIGGQLAIGDVIDLAYITAGSSATLGYSGSNSPGTLTVGDGTRTATINLLGNYSLANFTPSSDGNKGTNVVDPPIGAAVPQASSVVLSPIATPAAAPVPTSQVATSDGTAGVAAVDATVASVASALIEAPATAANAPPVASPAQAALPTFYAAQTAREIVAPQDLILAIRNGGIALKVDPAAGAGSEARAPWLFDEDRGTFTAPPPEQLTIMLDGDADDTGADSTGLDNAITALDDGSMSSPGAEVLPDQSWLDQSWLGALRTALLEPARSWWRR